MCQHWSCSKEQSFDQRIMNAVGTAIFEELLDVKTPSGI